MILSTVQGSQLPYSYCYHSITVIYFRMDEHYEQPQKQICASENNYFAIYYSVHSASYHLVSQ